MKKKVAVIMDGGFVRKTFSKVRHASITVDQMVRLGQMAVDITGEELFRIYYYDCTPFEKKLKKPVSQAVFQDMGLIAAGKRFKSELSQKSWIAYRQGDLRFNGWTIDNAKLEEILRTNRALTDTDFKPIFKQKRVDIKIGLDIAWLAIKKIVDRIVLIAGDRDFIPAMKLARIEGVQILIAPLGNSLNVDMREHSDAVRDIDISTL